MSLLSSNSRRTFIRIAGGGVVFVAGAGLALTSYLNAGYPDSAVQAWNEIPASTDLRRWILAHALLAPNPHNRQPWIADLRTPNEIVLRCDGQRLLPETDPFGRQILIGCGAFVELAQIAAAQQGYAMDVTWFPSGVVGDQQLPSNVDVARLKIRQTKDLTPDPLFAQIRRRHTNKFAYDSARRVSAGHWAQLLGATPSVRSVGSDAASLLGGVAESANTMQEIRDITRKAYEIELTTPRTYLESARLLRIGPTQIDQHRDGISIPGGMPRLIDALGQFDRQQVPAKGNTAYTATMNRWPAFETGSGYYWLASVGNSRVQQLESGRSYVRAHLTATALGIDMHPLSQALQEFPEMTEQHARMHQVLDLKRQGATLQMLARVGYASKAAQGSPRRSISLVVA